MFQRLSKALKDMLHPDLSKDQIEPARHVIDRIDDAYRHDIEHPVDDKAPVRQGGGPDGDGCDEAVPPNR
ncbi:hypothetical protein [Martelella sp. HB161492]|uniref:hypothetical protein n=1 Tax=Martelella sp. HB161492 TaxID=2720726 RepID=UPI001590A8B4|nr:hypothetical protein [Martelella sp. HB161492]